MRLISILKLIALFLWITALSVFAGESQLVECIPRGGLPNFFAKLEHGGTVNIGYLGGSITAQEGWRPLTLKWFQQQYPEDSISQINAAIGGTGSDLGVFRLHQDVLDKKPDLLFVEFAVNDAGAPPEQIYRAMEGIVRQTWRDNPSVDICFVYSIVAAMVEPLNQGKLPRSYAAMEKIAEHYHIPSINMGLEVARLEQAGKLVFKVATPQTEAEKAALVGKILFSPDGTHPYPDSGHPLYLAAIVRSMELIKSGGKAIPHPLGEPFVADNWENAKMIPLDKATLNGHWNRLDPATNSVAKSFANRLPELWRDNQPGDSIEFAFRGTTAAIYDVIGPDSGQVVVTLDHQKPVIFQQFDAYCTYYRPSLLKIGSNLSNTVHTVKLEICPDQPDKVKILSQRQQTMDDPKRFDDRAWYPGAILVVGDLVP
jgi:lysophospholipase L1-like esterase